MNKYGLFLLSLFAILGCISDTTKKSDNEKIIQKLELNDIFIVDLAIAATMEISTSEKQTIEIIATKEDLEKINKKVERGRWRVNAKEKLSGEKITIKMTTNKLEGLILSGSGRIDARKGTMSNGVILLALTGSGNLEVDLNAENTAIRCSGSGNIDLIGSSKIAGVIVSGSGSILGKDFICRDADVAISGSGNCALNVEKNGDRRNHRIRKCSDIWWRRN